MIYLNNKPKQQGFTIVELLIVIVVIAILVAITIVSYNGVSNKAKTVAAQSAADNVVKKAEIYNAEKSSYPATLATLTGASQSEAYQLTGVVQAAAGLLESAGHFKASGTDLPPTKPETVNFVLCGSTGVKVFYFNYSKPADNATSFVTAGSC